jgi:hypothetical protein
MGMFTENEREEQLAGKLKWVARNILRIKDFNHYSANPYRDQIDGVVDYIRESISGLVDIEQE